MGSRSALPLVLLVIATLAAGCGTASNEAPQPAASPQPTIPAASATTLPTSGPAESATPTASPTPTETRAAWDMRVRRLRIPALGIDAEVVGSEVVSNTSSAPPGCPTPEPGSTTLTVPNEDIATPEEAFEGLENTAWLFGHSRWQGEPGLFYALQDLAIGDEIVVDGEDRATGAVVNRQRFVVEGIYLADKESGGDLVTAESSEEVRTVPTLVLQTSARGSGDRQWLLDQEQIMARAENLVAGDLDDPCKYLLLLVVAEAS